MFKKIERYMDKIFNTKPTLTFRSAFDVFMAGILIVPAILYASIAAILKHEDTVAVLMVLIFGLGGLVLFGFGIYELALLLKGTL